MEIMLFFFEIQSHLDKSGNLFLVGYIYYCITERLKSFEINQYYTVTYKSLDIIVQRFLLHKYES